MMFTTEAQELPSSETCLCCDFSVIPIDSELEIYETESTTMTSVTRDANAKILPIMIILSVTILLILEGAGMYEMVFSYIPLIARGLYVLPSVAFYLSAIVAIEIGSIVGLIGILSRANLLIPDNTSIFSKNLGVGMILIFVILQTTILGWLNPEIGIPISIATLCIILCYSTDMIRKRLSYNFSARIAE